VWRRISRVLRGVLPRYPPGTDRTSYAAGGGIEYAFTEKLSAKVEVLYIHPGRGFTGSTYYSASIPANYGAGKQDLGFALVKAGVNFRF
jgi:outer membrane immunogenic protein